MSSFNSLALEKLVSELQVEAQEMYIKTATKRSHWSFPLWWLLDWFLKRIGHQGILDSFTTVIGRTIFQPGDQQIIDSAAVFSHEMQHLREKYGPNKNFFSAIWWDLKWLFSKSFRREAECRGFVRTIEAWILQSSPPIDQDDKDYLVRYLTDVSYFWLMSKDTAIAWVNEVIPWILYMTANGTQPLPKTLPPIKGMITEIPA
jgi:hypothetical protein